MTVIAPAIGRRARSLAADHVGSGQGGDEGLIARVVLGMLEGGIVRAALQKLFVLCARMVFRVAVGRCDLTMMGLLWLRAGRRRSRIFEHALQQNAFRAAALIFHEKYAPTFDKWAAIRHSCFRISLVNESALATIASVVRFGSHCNLFASKKKTTKKVTGGRRGTGKQDARPWSPLVAARPGRQPIRQRCGAERRQPAM